VAKAASAPGAVKTKVAKVAKAASAPGAVKTKVAKVAKAASAPGAVKTKVAKVAKAASAPGAVKTKVAKVAKAASAPGAVKTKVAKVAKAASAPGAVAATPEGFVKVGHPDNASCSHGGVSYAPDENGHLTVPSGAVADLAAFGFVLVEIAPAAPTLPQAAEGPELAGGDGGLAREGAAEPVDGHAQPPAAEG
jgi:hypothetical protein